MREAVVILGPTASGKSSLSLELAKLYDSEIISLDSALIYRGMDVGTAKPSKEEQAICPHHLIDICEPNESYSAAQFRHDCIQLVEEISRRGRLPIICGGTMMYYKALVDGLSPLPETDEKVRADIAKMAQEKGWPYMHEMLKEIDPPLYNKLAPNDKQRVSRALEVYTMTGKAMSSFFADKKDECPFSRLELVLLPQNNDRSLLREQIRKRFLKMLEHNFLEEVKNLIQRGDLHEDMPSMRAVGYRQALMYLQNKVSYEEMIELSVIATARLAKHQMTWLRGGLHSTNLNQGQLSKHEQSSVPKNCKDVTSLKEQTTNSFSVIDIANLEALNKDDLNFAHQQNVKRCYLEIEDQDKLHKVHALLQQSSFARFKK